MNYLSKTAFVIRFKSVENQKKMTLLFITIMEGQSFFLTWEIRSNNVRILGLKLYSFQ